MRFYAVTVRDQVGLFGHFVLTAAQVVGLRAQIHHALACLDQAHGIFGLADGIRAFTLA
jgi:hypothetical protein